ncbi:MAPEG family protein [Bacterioplanoides sp.]|uniref:MAPEG family protein n=1 Tax=Bacterioplanoides sp. TaxID=2066072 RepID=UPI003AFFBDF4
MIPISGLYIALTALLLLTLAYKVVQQRHKLNVGLLDGGERSISVAMRAQANALEVALPTLLLLLVAELNGAPAWLLHLCGIGFLASRGAHAYGFTLSGGRTHPGRYYGTLVSWITLLILIGYALYAFVAA